MNAVLVLFVVSCISLNICSGLDQKSNDQNSQFPNTDREDSEFPNTIQETNNLFPDQNFPNDELTKTPGFKSFTDSLGLLGERSSHASQIGNNGRGNPSPGSRGIDVSRRNYQPAGSTGSQGGGIYSTPRGPLQAYSRQTPNTQLPIGSSGLNNNGMYLGFRKPVSRFNEAENRYPQTSVTGQRYPGMFNNVDIQSNVGNGNQYPQPTTSEQYNGPLQKPRNVFSKDGRNIYPTGNVIYSPPGSTTNRRNNGIGTYYSSPLGFANYRQTNGPHENVYPVVQNQQPVIYRAQPPMANTQLTTQNYIPNSGYDTYSNKRPDWGFNTQSGTGYATTGTGNINAPYTSVTQQLGYNQDPKLNVVYTRPDSVGARPGAPFTTVDGNKQLYPTNIRPSSIQNNQFPPSPSFSSNNNDQLHASVVPSNNIRITQFPSAVNQVQYSRLPNTYTPGNVLGYPSGYSNGQIYRQQSSSGQTGTYPSSNTYSQPNPVITFQKDHTNIPSSGYLNQPTQTKIYQEPENLQIRDSSQPGIQSARFDQQETLPNDDWYNQNKPNINTNSRNPFVQQDQYKSSLGGSPLIQATVNTQPTGQYLKQSATQPNSPSTQQNPVPSSGQRGNEGLRTMGFGDDEKAWANDLNFNIAPQQYPVSNVETRRDKTGALPRTVVQLGD